MECEDIKLFRKGRVRGDVSCWFPTIDEAVCFELDSEEIYHISVSQEEFQRFFVPSGIGYSVNHSYAFELSDRVMLFEDE